MREEWNFPEMQHFAVKVVCKDDSGHETIGSGTVVVDDGHFYVLTAGHCICYKTDEDYVLYDEQEISIMQYSDSKETLLPVQKIVICDNGEKDYAVLEIGKIEDGFDYVNKVKRARMIISNGTFLFVGYPKVASKGRFFTVAKVGEHCLHLKDLQIDGQLCTGEELSSGCSGAGIFLYRHSRYYMLGYLTEIRDKTAAYSDFLWNDEDVFDSVLSVDSRDDITIDLIQKWDKLDEESNKQMVIGKLNEEHSEWMDNLNRKCSVLFPGEEKCKLSSFLNDYISGELRFMGLKNSNPTFDDELQKLLERGFEKKTKKMPTIYENSEFALQNLYKLEEFLIDLIKNEFPEDNKELDISNSYVDYQLAYRLLNCSLEFKKS